MPQKRMKMGNGGGADGVQPLPGIGLQGESGVGVFHVLKPGQWGMLSNHHDIPPPDDNIRLQSPMLLSNLSFQ